VLDSERKGEQRCSFQAERSKLASCDMETDEHAVVSKYINKKSIVLELGARYGTTSCQIAHVQGNTGLVLSVEIDPAVWSVLAANQASHKCNFHVLEGAVGNKEIQIFGTGYGTKALPPEEMEKHNLQGAVHAADGKMLKKGINKNIAIGTKKGDRKKAQALLKAKLGAGDIAGAREVEASTADPDGGLVKSERRKKDLNLTTVPAVTFPELNTRMKDMFSSMVAARADGATVASVLGGNYNFNTLLIDCEGCINNLFVDAHIPAKLGAQLKHVHTIMLEADMPEGHCLYYCVDYAMWVERFRRAGLVVKHVVPDRVYTFIKHYVFVRD